MTGRQEKEDCQKVTKKHSPKHRAGGAEEEGT